MSVKKVVSNEPEWIIKRRKSYAVKKTTDTVSVYVVKTERPEIRFVFNGKCAEVFGERYMVFSDITNPNRIYFKIDDDKGYKTTRYKTHTQVHFVVTEEQREAVKALWVGADYEVHEERGYYYIERVDEIEALFDEPERVMKALKTEKVPTVKKTSIEPPTNAAFMAPMPESGINDKKVVAVLTRMKEKGFVAMRDLKGMNMNDREYYKAVGDLVMVYGYAIVDIPCIDATGKRFFVKALYNGTGVWE